MKKLLLCIIILELTSLVSFAQTVSSSLNRGNSLYRNGEFDRALENYENALLKSPDSDIINFNLGAALYKKGSFPEASNHFSKALLSKDKSIEQKANYNIGNAKYKEGISKEDSDLAKAIELLEQSLGYYKRTGG